MKSYSLVLSFVILTAGVIGANQIAKLHSYESVIEFELSIKKLEDAEDPACVQSSEFQLNDMTWKIQACRNNEYEVDYDEDHPDDVKFVHMSLVSVFRGESTAWSCEASATFKLLAINGQEPIVKKLPYYKFNKDESVQTIEDFVNKEDLFEKHINDGCVTFEITISAKTPNRAAKLDESSAKFDVRINNVDRYDYEYSNELIVRGIRWKVLTKKIENHLGIFLFANGDDMGINVSWKASANVYLISSTAQITLSRSFSDISFDWTNLNYGFSKFTEWNDLIDTSKKFVENNKAIIKVELSVSEPMENL